MHTSFINEFKKKLLPPFCSKRYANYNHVLIFATTKKIYINSARHFLGVVHKTDTINGSQLAC